MMAGHELSPVQRRLLAQAGAALPFGLTIGWQGDVTGDEFLAALARVCLRHEILSSAFVTVAGAVFPLQVTGAQSAFAETAEKLAADSLPLVAVASTRDGHKWRHNVTFSALVADTGCLELLHRDLLAELDGKVPESPTDYSMMAQWLNELPGTAEGETLAAYWRQTVTPGPWLCERGNAEADPEFATVPVEAADGDVQALRALAERCGAEFHDALSGLWALVLSQSLAERHIVFGTFTGGRLDSDLADLMGPLGRYLPTLIDIDPVATVAETFAAIAASRHGGERSAEGYQLSAAAYFGASLEYVRLPGGSAVGSLQMTGAFGRSGLSGVRLICVDAGDRCALSLDSLTGDPLAARLDPAALAERVRAGLARLSTAAAADPLTAIDVLPGAEAAQAVLREPPAAAASGSMAGLFLEQVRRSPEAIAVAGEDGGNLTYAQLDTLADRYAEAIAELGAHPGDRAILRLGRGPEIAAALLGAWRLGTVPVLVDPHLPDGRLIHIRRSSQAVGEVSNATPVPDRLSRAVRRWQHAETDPAYCIYTSGSTGEPVGVIVGHGALASHCAGMAGRLGLSSGDRIALTASTGFDVSIEQICLPWAVGARSCLQARAIPTLDELTGFLQQTRVTVLNLTPSLWRVLGMHWLGCGSVATDIRMLILGAEVLRPGDVALASEVLPGARVFNAYGPTEAVITATIDEVRDGAEPAIGRPLPGRSVAVVDHRGLLVPRGVTGQLAIGGRCLAAGYLNNAELSASRFITTCWPGGAAPERVLLTGDFAAFGSDGRLTFHGRRDRQVKVRGQRVELDDVEANLASCPGITGAAVTAAEDAELVAVVTPAGTDISRLRAQLAERVAPYMVPDRILAVREIPRLGNGKVDYRQLETMRTGADRPSEPPATATERLVAALWSEVLGAGRVERESDFFELGGQSLGAIVIVSRLRPQFGEQVKVATLFTHSKLREFATELDRLRSAVKAPPGVLPRPAGAAYTYEPSHAQQRIWFMDQFIAAASSYNAPTALIAPRRMSVEETTEAWQRLAAHHDALRTTFTEREGIITAAVGERSQVEVRAVDLSASAEADAAFTRCCLDETAIGFDLEQGPIGRVTLFCMPDGRSRCFVNLHHIVTDLWSTRILLRDFVSCVNSGHPVSARSHRYRDYAWLERQLASSEAWREYEIFLLSELSPPPPPLELPFDFARPEVQAYDGAELQLEVDAVTRTVVEEFAQARGLTPFMVFLTAYLIMLRRLSNQDDITVGFPVSGRDRPEFHDVVGFFVGTSFVRINFAVCGTVEWLLAEVKDKVAKAMRCQEYPFDKLVSTARLPRSVSHSPVFTTMIAHQDLPPLSDEAAAQGWQLTAVPDHYSKFDLSLTTWFEGDAVHASLTYSTALFTGSSVASFALVFRTCLARLLETG
jgi:amino acid adenylation domain-containing protein